MVKRADKPYIVSVTAKGKTYWYFRRRGKYLSLPGHPDSPEFDEAYWAIRSGRMKAPVSTTFNALIDSYYRSPKFKAKKPNTQREYRRTLELIRSKNGDKDFTKIRRKHVIAARDKYADTWRKANAMVEMISILAKHAIDMGWIEANPAMGVEKLKGGEYEAWPQEKLDAFERYCRKEGEEWALTAFMLGTGTGQRIGDVVKMEWADFDGEAIHVVQEKTDEKMWVACPPFLIRYLSELPRKGRYIIAKNLTQPVSKRAIQTHVMDVRKAIGAEAYVIHGWRYTAARELAEAGCSDAEIMAVTGHRTGAMAQKYRKQASRSKMSKSAQEKRR